MCTYKYSFWYFMKNWKKLWKVFFWRVCLYRILIDLDKNDLFGQTKIKLLQKLLSAKKPANKAQILYNTLLPYSAQMKKIFKCDYLYKYGNCDMIFNIRDNDNFFIIILIFIETHKSDFWKNPCQAKMFSKVCRVWCVWHDNSAASQYFHWIVFFSLSKYWAPCNLKIAVFHVVISIEFQLIVQPNWKITELVYLTQEVSLVLIVYGPLLYWVSIIVFFFVSWSF